MAERADKAWTYLQTEHIYEHNQSEILRIEQHVVVYIYAQGTCQDSSKEHKGGT